MIKTINKGKLQQYSRSIYIIIVGDTTRRMLFSWRRRRRLVQRPIKGANTGCIDNAMGTYVVIAIIANVTGRGRNRFIFFTIFRFRAKPSTYDGFPMRIVIFTCGLSSRIARPSRILLQLSDSRFLCL